MTYRLQIKVKIKKLIKIKWMETLMIKKANKI